MTKEDKKDDLEAVRILVDALTPFDNIERNRIIRWACEKLGVSYDVTATRPASLQTKIPPSTLDGSNVGLSTRRPSSDIKSFIDNKNPKNDQQLAAVVAYYFAFEAPELERKSSIGSDDLVDACRLAHRHRPKKPVQTLFNAAFSGFLDKAEETGKYKLNAVGENLVAMTLPSSIVEKRMTRKVNRTSSKKKVAKKVQKKNRKR